MTTLRLPAQNLVIVKIKQAYHHGALREALVTAAAQLLAEHGAAGVSLREAARRAGVSQAAPYHYFASKAALIAAVGEAGCARLDAMEAAVLARTAADPASRLRALVTTNVRFAVEHPALFRAMPPRVSARFAEAVHDARFAVGHDDLDASAIATLLWALPHGLTTIYLSGAGGITPVQLEHLSRVAVDALLALPAQDVGTDWAV